MSDSEEAAPKSASGTPNNLGDLLANFSLGPAWARAGGGKSKSHAPKGDRGDRFGDREKGGGREQRGERRGRDDRSGKGGGFAGKGGGRFNDRRGDGGARRDFEREEPPPPAPGVRLMIAPDRAALHLISKEVHQVARVYSLFDIAETLLADRQRCRAVFEVDENHPPLLRGKVDDSVFLTRSEAVAHLWQLRAQFMDEEMVEVDPPGGNYVAVARCGISGEWLGPPNFHTYQTNLRRLHRERFANMPFEAYQAKVRTERGEEAVNAWLDSMRKQTRWRLKGADEDVPWMADEAEAARALEAAVFDQAFEATRRADVSGAIVAANLSPGLLSTLKRSGGHTRKHPAMLIPAVCKALEAEHLPVFKRKGNLHTGPARPLALPKDAVLAERPARMVEWIRANQPAKLEGLWQAVLPEGGTAPPAEYAADLFWMLQQGHILLFTDDTLVVQEHHEKPQPKAKKLAKKQPKQPRENRRAKEEAPATEEGGQAETGPPAPAEATEPDNPDNPAEFAVVTEEVAADVPAPENPAAEGLPAEEPVIEEPPVEAPLVEAPPVEAPPVEEPPIKESPIKESPASESSPVEESPADDDPADDSLPDSKGAVS